MISFGFRTVVRIARKQWDCYDCGKIIRVGERYKDVIAAPWYDSNPNPGHWTQGRFCIPKES